MVAQTYFEQIENVLRGYIDIALLSVKIVCS